MFGAIHASSALATIGRILDLFPEEVRGAIRSAIAFDMKGIVGTGMSITWKQQLLYQSATFRLVVAVVCHGFAI